MGIKMLWVGLTIVTASVIPLGVPFLPILGAIIMIIGCVMLVMDR